MGCSSIRKGFESDEYEKLIFPRKIDYASLAVVLGGCQENQMFRGKQHPVSSPVVYWFIFNIFIKVIHSPCGVKYFSDDVEFSLVWPVIVLRSGTLHNI